MKSKVGGEVELLKLREGQDVREGDVVDVGQRVGLIRFGSRVDVYLPAGTSPKVLLGQRAIAGETVIAEIGVDASLTGISQ